MRTFTTGSELSSALDAARRAGRSVGVVPTMGALHAGHRSLVERAVRECDAVAVTIFVNPLQFDDPEDIERYPRTMPEDLAQCREAGVSFVFAPPVREMYPDWPEPQKTIVSVGGVSESWEGTSRPGHFDGVATVLCKLFALTGPCRAYFGEKDFQQLVLVRTLVRDLSIPVQVVGCPTVREADGLALSSRNVRLSPEERAVAAVLPRALRAARAAASAGESEPGTLAHTMADVVSAEPRAELDYAAVVDPVSLKVPARATGSSRAVIAVRIGTVRLIDNGTLDEAQEEGIGGPCAAA